MKTHSGVSEKARKFPAVLNTAACRWAAIWCCLILFATPGWGQRAAGLAGSVTDATGASIVDATVTSTNVATGVQTSTVTNQAGLYRFIELVAGSYEVGVEQEGFKKHVSSVVLEGARVTTVDISLEIGDVVQVIEVAASAVTLETETQTVSNQVEGRLIHTLPVSLRRPLQLLTVAAAIAYNGTEPTTTQTPFYSLAGGPTLPAVYIDGGNATNTRVESNVHDINPSIEVTSEFRVVANGYKAEYGGSAGGLLLMTTKSGTNEFHGTGWWFHRQQAFDARNLFAQEPAPFREHIFGVGGGGPIIKNKLFFFGTYERTKFKITNLTGAGRGLTAEFFQTMPTLAQRDGDFSGKTDAAGNLKMIYDPRSTEIGPGGSVTRTAFPNNIIPRAQQFDVGRNILALIPVPNTAPSDLSGSNNFVSTADSNSTDRWALTSKFDYAHSDKDRFFWRVLLDNGPFQYDGPWPGAPGVENAVGITGDPSTRNWFDRGDMVLEPWSRNQAFTWTRIVSPTVINDLRFTYATRSWGGQHLSAGQGFPQQIGLSLPKPVAPTTEKFDIPNDAFPNISASGYAMPGNGWIGSGDWQLPMRNWNLIESITTLKGSHSLKFGYESRRSSATMYTHLRWPGNYNFSTRGTALNPDSDSFSGDSVASLLLDWPDSGDLSSTALRHFLSWWHSFYVQDDWKVTRNFTLNIGFRYEVDTPMTESLTASRCTTGFPCEDRLNGFDFNTINQVSGTPGVATYPDTYWDQDSDNFAPRIGFSWNVAPNTVIRGGGGLFYGYHVQWGLRGAPGLVRPDVTTNVATATVDRGLTAPYHLTTGLPQPPAFDGTLDPAFGAVPVGDAPRISPDFMLRDNETPYGVQWNFNAQHQLESGLFFELGWLANIGHQLFGRYNVNQVFPATVGTEVAGNIQAIRPFPQYNGVLPYMTIGNSNYHALVFKVEQRYRNGLSFVSHYTWSKYLTDTNRQNWYNRQVDRGLTSNDLRHRFVWAGSYELPAGHGRRWLNSGPIDYLLGGWDLTPQFTVVSGRALNASASAVNCACFAAGGIRPNRVSGTDTKGAKTQSSWFNLGAFSNQGPLVRGDDAFGDASPGSIVGPGAWTLDLSVSKNVVVAERLTFNIRGEFFNALNHANLGNPSTTIFPVGSPGTTNIITSAREPRRIQLGVRILW